MNNLLAKKNRRIYSIYSDVYIQLIVLKEEKTQLPTFVFEEAEEELTKLLILDGGEEIDGALNLTAHIVDKVRRQIEKETFGDNLKQFLITLTKTFTLLLNVKVDTDEKIVKIVQLLNSLIAKKWLEQK